jgi:hypothetical protein
MLRPRRRRWNLTHSGKQAEQGKPDTFPMGRAAVKPTNDVAGKDAGESEGRTVMVWIRVQHLPGVKTSRLPAGVSSRGNWINNFHVGRQMTAGFSLAGAPTSGNV